MLDQFTTMILPKAFHHISLLMVSTPPVPILPQDSQVLIQRYVADILKCYSTITALPHLRPCPTVNQAFNELTTLCSQVPEDAVVQAILSDPKLVPIMPHLRQLCSAAECLLERFWADRIISLSLSPNDVSGSEAAVKAPAELLLHAVAHARVGPVAASMALLKIFPYYKNYRDLTALELSAITLFGTPRRIAFLGSGPLPLTSLCLLSQLQSSSPSSPPPFILNIDHSLPAINCAQSLCNITLSIPTSTLAFERASAGSPATDLTSFDVVYLAALVGETALEKRDISTKVLGRMRPGALLVVRTAHALRGVMYPAVSPTTDLDPTLFEALVVVHPYHHVINSVIIGRVRENGTLP